MQLSNRFLNLVQQQLFSVSDEASLERLVVYVAQARDGQEPSLEVVGQWPSSSKALSSVESDIELRTPSPHRRWYPLREGSILLGVLRAEVTLTSSAWPNHLDSRLNSLAIGLTNSLSLELDRSRLLRELGDQREQISLMVHQVRNPVAALRTYAQLLLRRLDPESKDLNLVEALLSEQDQLDRYISAFDQIGQSDLPIQSEGVSPLLLPPLLPQSSEITVRKLLEPLISRASATANLQRKQWHGPSSWPVWTEKERPSGDGVVAEIVANLLENAFRYSKEGDSIGLCLMDNRLCVWDSGNPIPSDERDKIFTKGFRGKSALDLSGTGLGLALGLQLAKKIGGSLELVLSPANVDQSLPLKGNAFLLTIPTKVTLAK